MKLILNIKPNIIEDSGTMLSARIHISQFLNSFISYSTEYGSAYEKYHDKDAVYGYNIEVFKRGKHRKNKHYVIYEYRFPIEVFKLFKIKINQDSRHFTIEDTRKK